MSETIIKEIVENIQHKVKDLSLAADGRKALDISEKEMPGLMSTRKKYGEDKPLAGKKTYRLSSYDGRDGNSN